MLSYELVHIFYIHIVWGAFYSRNVVHRAVYRSLSVGRGFIKFDRRIGCISLYARVVRFLQLS